MLYVNGCSHTAAAEAAVPDAFAVDDGRVGIDRSPHPRNLAVSWCTHVAQGLEMPMTCQAESGSSNARIIRTTRDWLRSWPGNPSDVFVIIQWSTWEREEWYHEGTWYQVNASGADWVPEQLRDRYRQFVIDVDWHQKTQQAHTDIWHLHQELLLNRVRHLFFSGHNTFQTIQDRRDWGVHYMDPYGHQGSFHNWLSKNGGSYVNPRSYHFDAKSHRLWGHHVLQYIIQQRLLDKVV